MRMQPSSNHRSAAEDLRPLSRMMKALGDEARLRMVALLAHGELCVCHLEAALGLPQWSTSRHLAVLRAAGLVEHDRRGTWVYYRLAAQDDPDRKRVLRSVLARFRRQGVFRRDAERLLGTRGPKSCR
jgi:ArsR family transcriptional regulator